LPIGTGLVVDEPTGKTVPEGASGVVHVIGRFRDGLEVTGFMMPRVPVERR